MAASGAGSVVFITAVGAKADSGAGAAMPKNSWTDAMKANGAALVVFAARAPAPASNTIIIAMLLMMRVRVVRVVRDRFDPAAVVLFSRDIA
jgi:hypothetical protein